MQTIAHRFGESGVKEEILRTLTQVRSIVAMVGAGRRIRGATVELQERRGALRAKREKWHG
jgi:hypothetical protein